MPSERPAPLRVVSPIHKASRQIGEYIAEFSRAHGVEPGEGHVLSYVTVYGPCRATELARVFGHKPSTLTGILDRLEGAALLVREPNEEDRRSLLIRATAAGAETATAVRSRLEAMEAEIMAVVGPGDMAGFEAVMRAIGGITGVDLRREGER